MTESIQNTVAILQKTPDALEEILARNLPRYGRSWALALVLLLEQLEREAGFPRPEAHPPLWTRVLLAVEKQSNDVPVLEKLEAAQWTDPLAQAVARRLGFTAGLDRMDLILQWLGDTSPRSASIGPLLLPFLDEPDARTLCLDAIGERSDVDVTIALSPHWFVAHGAEEPFVIEFELLAKDRNARSDVVRAEAAAWFSALRKACEPLEAEPYQQLLLVAKGEPHWEAVFLAAIADVADERRRLETKKREQAAKEQARKAAKQAAFAARDEAAVNEFVAKNRKCIGKRVLVRGEFEPMTLDLGKLFRCGWRKRESEESHKFLVYIARKVDGHEAEIRIADDIYWDEIPEHGIRAGTMYLPEAFGNRSPSMVRILGEIVAARIESPKEA